MLRWTSWASSGRDQKSGATVFSLSSASALRAASRSKIAPERREAIRGSGKGGQEVVAFGHERKVSGMSHPRVTGASPADEAEE
jgi:hypothetical protein